MFLSPKFTSAAVASVLGNMQPLGVLVFAVLLLGETITRWKVCALLFGLNGVTLIAFQASSGEGSNEWLGAALAFGSSLSSGVARVIFKKLMPSKSLVALTGWQMVAGSLALLALSLPFDRQLAVRWNLTFIGVLLLLAIVGYALPTVAWVWLLQKYEAGSLSIYLFLTPLFGIVVSYVALHERLGWIQLGGVASIVAGVALGLFHPLHASVANSIEQRTAPVRTKKSRNGS